MRLGDRQQACVGMASGRIASACVLLPRLQCQQVVPARASRPTALPGTHGGHVAEEVCLMEVTVGAAGTECTSQTCWGRQWSGQAPGYGQDPNPNHPGNLLPPWALALLAARGVLPVLKAIQPPSQ